MDRREFVLAAGGAALGVLARSSPTLAQGAAGAFGRGNVVELARDLATKEYRPRGEVPELFGKLGYDQYRDIRFRQELGFWVGEQRGFTLELLHAGFIYKNPVEVYVVEAGTPVPVRYTTHLFDFGPHLEVPPLHDQPLFSGIRLRAPINTPDRMDEFVVFQGASYFRALGAGQIYGASARGLAVNTAEPAGEEFPAFRSFWVERPERGAKTVVVHALLDSPSVTGAYTFHITPGRETVMDVEATLFARSELTHLGVAPLTSMYFFASPEAHQFDDYRPRVHDSDTLAIAQTDGWLVRPLANPKLLQVSAFQTSAPRGFGLQQRADRYADYKDLEARYELRPSIWAEPKKEDWGEGQVELIEIPTVREFNDNIVAFWRPSQSLAAGRSQTYSYWLRWGAPVYEKQLAHAAETRSGLTLDHARRLFIVDFAAPEIGSSADFFDSEVQQQVFGSQGVLKNIVGQRNTVTGGYQVSFELDVSGVELSELRLFLLRENRMISEIWLYRWTPR